jgi:Bacterial membrane protein YfhO
MGEAPNAAPPMPSPLRLAGRWGPSHPALVVAALYAALALVMVGGGLLPGHTLSGSDVLWHTTPWAATSPQGVATRGSNYELYDSVTQFQPFLSYTHSVLPHAPLWNPYLMSGRPFLANQISAVFSPFSLPAYVLPFWHALALIAALKLFTAAFGMYLLARFLGARLAGAALAGLIYGFSLAMITWVPWPQSSVWALIPWLLLATAHVVRRPGPTSTAALALIVGLQFSAGHPESSFDALSVTVLFFLLRLLVVRPSAACSRTATLGFVLGLTGGAALAAIVLIPFLELLSHSSDTSAHAFLRAHRAYHVPSRYLFGLLVPNYWGRPDDLTAPGLQTFFLDRAFYVGAFPLMLVSAALMVRPTLERLAFAALAACALAVTVSGGPLPGVVASLPGVGTVRTDRLFILSTVSFALLAGWGLDELYAPQPAGRRRPLLVMVSLAILCLPLLRLPLLLKGVTLSGFSAALQLSWGFTTPSARVLSHAASDIVPLAALLEWVVLAGAAFVLLTMRLRGGLRASAFVLLTVILVTADLFKLGMGYNPTIPISHAGQPKTGAIAYLQSRRPMRFVGLDPRSTDPAPLPPLASNVAMRYGLYDARGYDFPVYRRYNSFWIANFPSYIPGARLTVGTPTPRALRALSLVSVADLVQAPSDPPIRLPGLSVAYQGRDATIYANARALPRVFLVGHQQVVRRADDALARVTSASFDARRIAITERRLDGLPQARTAGSMPCGDARLVSYEAERVAVHTSAARRCLLIVTDTQYPGWNATVDGRSIPIERVDYMLRGVALPAGVHSVEFQYQPESWRIGWFTSALALSALCVAFVIGWRRRREH